MNEDAAMFSYRGLRRSSHSTLFELLKYHFFSVIYMYQEAYDVMNIKLHPLSSF